MYSYKHTQQNNEGKWEQRHHFQAHKSIVRSLASTTGDSDAASSSTHVASSSDDGLVKIWKFDGSEVACVGTLNGTPQNSNSTNSNLSKHKHSGSHLSVHTLNVRENHTHTQTQTKFAVGRRDGSVAYIEKDPTYNQCQPLTSSAALPPTTTTTPTSVEPSPASTNTTNTSSSSSSSEEPWIFNKSAQLFGSDSEGLVLVHICGHMCAVSRAGVIEVWQLVHDACIQDEDTKSPSNEKDSETSANDSNKNQIAVAEVSEDAAAAAVAAAAKGKNDDGDKTGVDASGNTDTTTVSVAATTDAVAVGRAQDETNSSSENRDIEGGDKGESSSSKQVDGKATGVDGVATPLSSKQGNTAKWSQLCILQSGMYTCVFVCMFVCTSHNPTEARV
jgi:hypothetical protein